LKSGNHNFKDALRIFQQNSDIPDTGLLDAKTITEMRKPRCGVPDFDEGGSSINSGEDIMGVEWFKDQSTRVKSVGLSLLAVRPLGSVAIPCPFAKFVRPRAPTSTTFK